MIRYLIFPLFLLGSLSSAFSQVRGIVKDIAGEPIIGANLVGNYDRNYDRGVG